MSFFGNSSMQLALAAAAGALVAGVAASQCGKVSGGICKAVKVARTTAPTLEELRASLKHLAKVELGSDEMRAEFPLAFDAFTYCNNGSFGVAPSAVMTYREQLLRYVESNPDMWCFQESFKRIRGAIDILCAAEGLPADDTVFVMNATAGINVAVNALISKLTSSKDSAILMFDSTYGAVKNAVYSVAQEWGAQVIEIALPLPITCSDDIVKKVEKALAFVQKRGLTLKGALFDHITSSTGMIMPIRDIVSAVRKSPGGSEVCVIVDGAHAVGQVPLLYQDIDFYTTNLHKWQFAPRGSSLLYVSPRWQPYARPLATSHLFRADFKSRMYMEGTKDESALLSSVAAAVFAEEVGRDRISAYNRNLRKQAETVLARAWGKEGDADCYLCPIEMRGYMVQVKTPLLDPLTDPKNTASASASTSSSSSSSTSASSTPASSAATPAMFSAEEKDGFKNEAIPGVGTIGQLATKPHAGSKRANDLFNQLLTEYKICSPVVSLNGHIYCRISCQIFNRIEDYHKLSMAIKQIAAREALSAEAAAAFQAATQNDE